jgi:hypothetical protein
MLVLVETKTKPNSRATGGKKIMSLANKITNLAGTCAGLVRAGVGLEHETGFWGNVFQVENGWLRVVFKNRETYEAFEAKLVAALPENEEVKRQTIPPNPKDFSWNKKTREERIIRANHEADVENGMSEADASDSDAFERRVLGLDQ